MIAKQQIPTPINIIKTKFVGICVSLPIISPVFEFSVERVVMEESVEMVVVCCVEVVGCDVASVVDDNDSLLFAVDVMLGFAVIGVGVIGALVVGSDVVRINVGIREARELEVGVDVVGKADVGSDDVGSNDVGFDVVGIEDVGVADVG